MSTVIDRATSSSVFDPNLGEEVVSEITRECGILPQIELNYEAAIKTLWLTVRPAPKPVFTYDMLKSVTRVQRAVRRLWGSDGSYAGNPVRFFAFRGEGPVLTLGGDLDFYLDCLAKANRAGFEEYADAVVEAVTWNASSLGGGVITLAAIQGNAFGGGIDAPCSCNVVVAEQHALFSYPEVKFNHFPITATSVMSRRVGARDAHRMLASGKEYTAAQFETLGAVDAVAPSGGGADQWLRSYAAETLPMHAARLALNVAFYHRAGDLRRELEPVAKLWVDSMMRLSPMQISRLQRLAQAQERMLQFMYGEKPVLAS